MQDNPPGEERESGAEDDAGRAEQVVDTGRADRDSLLAMTELIAGDQPLPDLFNGMAPLLRDLANCDVLNLALYNPVRNSFVARLWERDRHRTTERERDSVADLPCSWVWQHQQPVFIPDLQGETRFRGTFAELNCFGVRSYAAFPLSTSGNRYGALGFGSRTPGWESERYASVLSSLARLMALAVESRDLRQESRQTRSQRAKSPQVDLKKPPFEAIIGNSPALNLVFNAASIVAQTDATVLITGETGTGKERIARAIHLMSPRKENAFIKLNCAAIPTGLLESELFGHEKGAFTGAVSQKVGRLELADRGTLLLDEVGDIPLELQPKLLRVLQDQEFERLGGTKTIKVNVRVLAATNKDLGQAVEEKNFRSDLYYRLHVFPLPLPALRERREDIPLLVQHFVRKYATRLNKRIDIIPDEAVECMMNYGWPGNVRELENFIERSVILSDGNRLGPPLGELRNAASPSRSESNGTLRDRERIHIIEVMRQTRGALSGPRGAAARLGLKRTTLQYRLQKLGISRHEYLD